MLKRTIGIAIVAVAAQPAPAIDQAHRDKARDMAGRAIEYLRAEQDAATGGWAVRLDGPVFPAITGLALNGMLMHPGIDEHDPAVKAAIAFLLKYRQPDGGIYDRVLPSYNTSIALSALARVQDPAARAAIKPAQDFLRTLQFGEAAATDGAFAGETRRVGRDHPFYGGVGYGSSGRPDLSNLSLFIQGMHDSGVPGDDPAFQRALVFLSRVQMLDAVNDMAYADGSRQGGFVYATAETGDSPGAGESKAAMIEETLDDGTKVSRLRCYGSMTYSGFKSLIYANLPPSDPRVEAASEWIRRNYTLAENPGVGTDGMYYYFLSFARAMDARGRLGGGGRTDSIMTIGVGGERERDWANDLVDRLAELQNADGSFRSVDDRWMENNPVLITAYALLALEHAGAE